MSLDEKLKRKKSLYDGKRTHYEIIKCVECGHISVRKETFYESIFKESYHYPTEELLLIDKILSAAEDSDAGFDYIGKEDNFDDCASNIIYNKPHSIIDRLQQVLPGFLKSLQYPRTASYNCLDGICQKCINKKNITIVFSTDNPINNYRRAYNKFNRRFSDGYIITDYRWELQHLKNEMSKELLCSISPEVYNSIILGSNPETPEDKENFAKKYVESAKEDLIKYLQEYTRGRIIDTRSYIDSKKYLDSKADEAIEFLKKCDCKVYRCKNDDLSSCSKGIRVMRCPIYPGAVVSKHKFYEIAERYHAEEALCKIIEHKGVDMLENYQSNFAKLLSALPHMIAKADVWG